MRKKLADGRSVDGSPIDEVHQSFEEFMFVN